MVRCEACGEDIGTKEEIMEDMVEAHKVERNNTVEILCESCYHEQPLGSLREDYEAETFEAPVCISCPSRSDGRITEIDDCSCGFCFFCGEHDSNGWGNHSRPHPDIRNEYGNVEEIGVCDKCLKNSTLESNDKGWITNWHKIRPVKINAYEIHRGQPRKNVWDFSKSEWVNKYRSESFDVEFNDWADQELMSHGKDISFKDWAEDEGMKHGNTEITEWAQHEDESHDARYGAEAEGANRYWIKKVKYNIGGKDDDYKSKMIQRFGKDGIFTSTKAAKKDFDEMVKQAVNLANVVYVNSKQIPYPYDGKTVATAKAKWNDNPPSRYGKKMNSVTAQGVGFACWVKYYPMVKLGAETFESKGYSPDKPYYATHHWDAPTTIMHPVHCGHYEMVMDGSGKWYMGGFYDTIEEMFTDIFGWHMDSQIDGILEILNSEHGQEIKRQYQAIKNIGDARKFAKKYFDFKLDFAPCFRKQADYDAKALNALPITVSPIYEQYEAETFEAQRVIYTCDSCGMSGDWDLDYCSHCDMDFCDSCDHFGDFTLRGVCEDSVNMVIEDSQYIGRKGERRAETDLSMNAEYDIQDMGITTIVADNEDEVWDKFTGDKVYSHQREWGIVDVRDAETSGQWEIGEQLEEAQMNAEGKKRSGILSDTFDELSLDSGGIKKWLAVGIIGGLTIFGYTKWK